MKKLLALFLLTVSVYVYAQLPTYDKRTGAYVRGKEAFVDYKGFGYHIPNIDVDTCVLSSPNYENEVFHNMKIYPTIEYGGKQYRLTTMRFCDSEMRGKLRLELPDLKTWCMLYRDDRACANYKFFAANADELWIDGKPIDSVLVIPDGTEFIGKFAFAGIDQIKRVVLPPSVKRIGLGAFFKCKYLKEINLNDDVVVGLGAFRETALSEEIKKRGEK